MRQRRNKDIYIELLNLFLKVDHNGESNREVFIKCARNV